jgi:transposase
MKTKTAQLDWREGRRRRAWELKAQGWNQQDSAAALGVTSGAVSQWLKRARERGVEALRRHPAPGRQPRLTPEQRAQLPALVEQGPEAYGFRGQVWTCQRVAEVIRRTFGVTYHPAHVSRLLHAVRHSVQQPRTRAAQRNAAAIQAWWRERWPALEKKRAPKGAPSSGEINRASICCR